MNLAYSDERSRFDDWPLALKSILAFWLFYSVTVAARALLGSDPLTVVQNKVAPGATWDGISDLPVDEATFQELVSDREPSVESAEAAAAPAPAAAPSTKPATN